MTEENNSALLPNENPVSTNSTNEPDLPTRIKNLEDDVSMLKTKILDTPVGGVPSLLMEFLESTFGKYFRHDWETFKSKIGGRQ